MMIGSVSLMSMLAMLRTCQLTAREETGRTEAKRAKGGRCAEAGRSRRPAPAAWACRSLRAPRAWSDPAEMSGPSTDGERTSDMYPRVKPASTPDSKTSTGMRQLNATNLPSCSAARTPGTIALKAAITGSHPPADRPPRAFAGPVDAADAYDGLQGRASGEHVDAGRCRAGGRIDFAQSFSPWRPWTSGAASLRCESTERTELGRRSRDPLTAAARGAASVV